MQDIQPKDQMLVDFEEANMTDHEFAAYCRAKGWMGDTNRTERFTQFVLPTGTVIAMVQYRDQAPINRWIYLPKGEC